MRSRRIKKAVTAAWAAILAASAQREVIAKEMRLENDLVSVDVDAGAGLFTVRPRGTEGRLAAEGRLGSTGGAARETARSHRAFGGGRAIEVSHPDGSRDVVAVHPGLPFALLTHVIRNGGAEAKVVREILPVSLGPDLGVGPDEVRVLGTCGLKRPAEREGGYAWMAAVVPATRAGIVAAWLTHDRGSGVVLSDLREGRVALDCRIDYGRLRIAAGADAETETLAVGCFADARLGLEAWAGAVARHYAIRLRPQPVGYCTWYSSPNGGAASERAIAELSAFAARELGPYGFSVVQIDDGWQLGQSKNGPRKVFGGHRPDGPYPSGMKPTADRIRADGLTAGIWFMPFAGTHDDPFYKRHQDWFVKRDDGSPYDTAWGGTCLDMTHPGAREYVRGFVRTISGWGYTYFKMDGLWTGTATKQIYVNSSYREDGIGDAVFSDPAKTNIEAYRDGLRLVREAAGDGVFFLGCCAPQNMRSYGGAFGLVDAMRVGPDNGANWGGLTRGPLFASRQWFLHGRVWYNDPDPVYVRAGMPLKHARLVCSWVAVTGSLNLSSEWLPGLPPERLDILRRTMPGHGLLPRPVDVFEREPASIWLLTDDRREPRRDVIGLFNWEEKPAQVDRSLEDIGLDGRTRYAAFDYWADAFLAPFEGRLRGVVEGQSCRVIAVREALARPFVISTSRHATQGIVDLLEEKWDGRSATLSGRSEVVGGAPCELRVVAFAPGAIWRVRSAEVSAADARAGAEIDSRGTNGMVRATVRSPKGRAVAWSLRFEKAPAPAGGPPAVEGLSGEAREFEPVRLAWERADGVSYEVARDGERLGATSDAGWTDAAVEPAKAYVYAVTAVDFAGRRSKESRLEVRTPAVPELGPVPPKPDVKLSTLEPLEKSTGWGRIGVGRSAEGNALRIGKDTFADGMGVHANSTLVYRRAAGWRRFVAVAGLDAETNGDPRASVVFEVVSEDAAGKRTSLARSPVLRFGRLERWHFDLELPGDCAKVRLVVGDAGDGIACDHADWADAGFVAE